MTEPLELQMVRVQEQLKAVAATLAEDRTLRKEADSKLEALVISVGNLDQRLGNVEKQLAQNAPTIEEFITIKHQVKGAGKAGAFAWMLGGYIIATLFQAREAIRGLFN